ncbi:peptidylprolyl isomerase [Roseivirga sp. E12]|uniref:peptidylprolyl isomerase n=1 Tax=Roseivirga sp. E12 TaxID=2819237 RepID=UPI001ABCB554|nr:peptidylprolyl isomerase [Roseivirga sp. E12]MBO3699613.1 peptidylprolyl isomerase [Roseivirga sp. E12]
MRNRIFQILSAACLVLIIASCGETKSSETPAAEGDDYLVTIKTSMGEMKAILYDETPKHKENFLKLVNDGFYDSLIFHRVISSFMIQGGDPESKNAAQGQPLGSGGPGYTVPAEFVPTLFHEKGALSAARQGDQVNPERASSGSQFYIVQGTVTPREQLEGTDQRKIITAFRECMQTYPESDLAKEYQTVLTENPGDNAAIQTKVESTLDRLTELTGRTFSMSEARIEKYSTIGGTPFLDDEYTVFGKVISGLDIVDNIASVQTAPGDRPVEDIRMFISVEVMPRAEIEEKYGYKYPVVLEQ